MKYKKRLLSEIRGLQEKHHNDFFKYITSKREPDGAERSWLNGIDQAFKDVIHIISVMEEEDD